MTEESLLIDTFQAGLPYKIKWVLARKEYTNYKKMVTASIRTQSTTNLLWTDQGGKNHSGDKNNYNKYKKKKSTKSKRKGKYYSVFPL